MPEDTNAALFDLQAKLDAVVNILREFIEVADRHLVGDAHKDFGAVFTKLSKIDEKGGSSALATLAGSFSMAFSYPHREG